MNLCIGKVKLKLGAFFSDERGAVTIDWVLLAAFVVVSAVGVMSLFKPGAVGAYCTVHMNNGQVTSSSITVEGGNVVSRLAAATQYKVSIFTGKLFGSNVDLPPGCVL